MVDGFHGSPNPTQPEAFVQDRTFQHSKMLTEKSCWSIWMILCKSNEYLSTIPSTPAQESRMKPDNMTGSNSTPHMNTGGDGSQHIALIKHSIIPNMYEQSHTTLSHIIEVSKFMDTTQRKIQFRVCIIHLLLGSFDAETRFVEARESWKWHVTENERVNEADAPLAGWQEAIYEAQPTPHEQEANRKQGKWSANLE
ncbi:hypothetical protein LSTR_LSTR003692 [Laodelphax striatellus]|uniref:Uncharacterized protein n=1 Tax=Laodelphax striatellus TaxID=195883 RepID=A0A482XBM1_LAOST|nr:hypothetical protein LSTR_LSTR003692 [Laodelphax striatellus]